jgi:hypothetical protein
VLKDTTDDSRILDSSAMTRIGALHPGPSSGSASYTLRISRAEAAFARAAKSLAGSSLGKGVAALNCGDAFFARSPRERFEYQPT